MKKNIVILYSKNRIDQTAFSLKEEFSKFKDEFNIITIPANKFSNFYGSSITDGFYKFTIRNMPWLNQLIGLIANKINNKKNKNKKQENPEETQVKVEDREEDKKPKNKNKEGFIERYKIQLRKVDNIIYRYDPEIVICTTPRSLTKALWAKERTNCKALICASITDYCVDRGFNSPSADYFIVQNQAEKQTLETLGIDEKKILVVGTPIVSSVKIDYPKEDILNEIGIENKELPVVSIVGGRYGSGRIKSAFKDIATYSGSINIVVMTNGAQNVKSFIQSYCKSAGITSNVYCIDAISDMSKIYSITDCLVTSPTASITYEALSRKIPCVLMKPSNNVESGNYSYLTVNGFALRGEKKSHIVPSVLSCINKEGEYSYMMENIKGNFSQDISQEYVNTILELISKDSIEQVEMKLDDVDTTIEKQTSKKKKERK